jgi:hypothetical protein
MTVGYTSIARSQYQILVDGKSIDYFLTNVYCAAPCKFCGSIAQARSYGSVMYVCMPHLIEIRDKLYTATQTYISPSVAMEWNNLPLRHALGERYIFVLHVFVSPTTSGGVLSPHLSFAPRLTYP